MAAVVATAEEAEGVVEKVVAAGRMECLGAMAEGATAVDLMADLVVGGVGQEMVVGVGVRVMAVAEAVGVEVEAVVMEVAKVVVEKLVVKMGEGVALMVVAVTEVGVMDWEEEEDVEGWAIGAQAEM